MPHLGAFGDDGIYLACGKALAAGSGYRIPSLPGEPSQTKYPFLYPLFLSFVWRASPGFPGNIQVFAVVAWMFVPLYLVLARLMFADLGVPRSDAWALCALCAVNPVFLLLGLTLLSDVMFSCVLLASLLLLRRAADAQGHAGALALLSGALAAAAYLTKTAAIPLVVAGPLFLLSRKRNRPALLFLSGVLPAALGWAVWTCIHRSAQPDIVWAFYTDYFSQHWFNVALGDYPRLLARNWVFMLHSIGGLLGPPSEWPYGLLFLGIIAGAGAARSASRARSPYHLFAALYFCMLLLWSYPPSKRFLVPLLPLLLFGLFHEVSHVAALLIRGTRFSDYAPVVRSFAMGAVCLAMLWGTRVLVSSLFQCRATSAEDRVAYEWIAANVPRESRFVSAADSLIYLYTGRRAIQFSVPTGFYYRDDLDGLNRWLAGLPEYARRNRLEYAFVNAQRSVSSLPERDEITARAVISSNYDLIFKAGPSCVYRIRPARPGPN